MQKQQIWSLGWEDPLEEGMATHSSILAWRIPMDREGWRAIVCRVTKNRTRLKQLSTHTRTRRPYFWRVKFWLLIESKVEETDQNLKCWIVVVIIAERRGCCDPLPTTREVMVSWALKLRGWGSRRDASDRENICEALGATIKWTYFEDLWKGRWS